MPKGGKEAALPSAVTTVNSETWDASREKSRWSWLKDLFKKSKSKSVDYGSLEKKTEEKGSLKRRHSLFGRSKRKKLESNLLRNASGDSSSCPTGQSKSSAELPPSERLAADQSSAHCSLPPASAPNPAPSPPLRPDFIPGGIGIVNHGNSCYINSIVQCLAHMDPVAEFFATDDYERDLNAVAAERNRRQGSGGTVANGTSVAPRRELTQSFAALLGCLWRHTYHEKISQSFRIVLGTYRQDYKTRDQQDAQEFLLFLLNTLHDELNRATRQQQRKASAAVALVSGDSTRSCPRPGHNINSSSGSGVTSPPNPASQVDQFVKANQSRVYDLCAGYQLSSLICPTCHRCFRSVQPYLCLSLPIPTKQTCPVFFTLVVQNYTPTRLTVIVNTADSVQSLRDSVAELVGVQADALILTTMTSSGFGKTYKDDDSIISLLSSTEASNPQVPVSPLCEGLVAIELPEPFMVKTDEGPDTDTSPLLQDQADAAAGQEVQLRDERSASSLDRYRRSHHSCYDNVADENGGVEASHSADHLDDSQNGEQDYCGDSCLIHEDPTMARLILIHAEERATTGGSTTRRRFSPPLLYQVDRSIEFHELEELVLNSLAETLRMAGEHHRQGSAAQQQRIAASLRFWVVDGAEGQWELTEAVTFPLLHDTVQRALNFNESGGGQRHIKLIALWSDQDRRKFLRYPIDPPPPLPVAPSHQSQPSCLIEAWPVPQVDPCCHRIARQFSGRAGQLQQPQHHLSMTATVTLQDCLKAYMTTEELGADDAWTCPSCARPQRATMRTGLWSTPDLLILHLKRFKQGQMNCTGGRLRGGGTSGNNKLVMMVDFPLVGLDLRPYMERDNVTRLSSRSASHLDRDHQTGASETQYDLIGVCNHYGTMSGGHYTAYCRSAVDARWRSFNDDRVTELPMNQVVQANAYILFYQRRPPSLPASQHHDDSHWSIHRLNFPPSAYLPQAPTTAASHSTIAPATVQPAPRQAQYRAPPKSDPPRRRLLAVGTTSNSASSSALVAITNGNTANNAAARDHGDASISRSNRQPVPRHPIKLLQTDNQSEESDSEEHSLTVTPHYPVTAERSPSPRVHSNGVDYTPASMHQQSYASRASSRQYSAPSLSHYRITRPATSAANPINYGYHSQRPKSVLYVQPSCNVLKTGASTIRVPKLQHSGAGTRNHMRDDDDWASSYTPYGEGMRLPSAAANRLI